ncbi:hypothetical protein [Streptomyces echinatus]
MRVEPDDCQAVAMEGDGASDRRQLDTAVATQNEQRVRAASAQRDPGCFQ